LMLAHPKVRAAQVSTQKPDVYFDCCSIGCEVFGMKEKT
jgi:dihydroneopterin aldolase